MTEETEDIFSTAEKCRELMAEMSMIIDECRRIHWSSTLDIARLESDTQRVSALREKAAWSDLRACEARRVLCAANARLSKLERDEYVAKQGMEPA